VLDAETRAAMADVAVRAAAAVDYRGAGTVEFLYARDGSFYFLEMNTRLQVEHPITELVTGVDLVHAQMLVAAGRPAPFTQASLTQRGHAIEVRICAEDPSNNFAPCPGRIDSVRLPGGPWVRVDGALYPGYEVPIHYDPMIAKLVVWGHDRPAAVARMKRALGELTITGIRTNIPFFIQVMRHAPFVDGDYDTGYIERYLGTEIRMDDGSKARIGAIAAALATYKDEQDRAGRMSPAGGEGTDPSAWSMAGRLRRLGRS
jgi:acetyl/propionyl-CoA carboxylase alpha subunit